MKKIVSIGVCFLIMLSTAFTFVSSGNEINMPEETELIFQEENNSPPTIEYYWDNTTSMSYKYHLATVDDIENMKNTIGIFDSNKNYNVNVNGHGTGLAPPTLENYETMSESIVIDEILPQPTLASSVDHSLEPHFPKIGNQGSQGSCTAWSIAYYGAGYLQAKDNNWDEASTGNTSQLLSPAWVYNKINGGVDSGSSSYDAYSLIKNYGCSALDYMPYNDGDHISWGSEAAWRNAPQHRLESSSSLFGPHNDSHIQDIKTIIEGGNVVHFVIDSSNNLDGSCFDGNYIISSLEYDEISVDHAQTIIGYDDSITEDGDVGAFKVANSWGIGWGDNGFYWITYEAFKENPFSVRWLTDKIQYEPSLFAAWKLSTTGARDANPVMIGIGVYPFGSAKYLSGSTDAGSYAFPPFMGVDMTDYLNNYLSGTNDFYLEIGSGSSSSTISDFWVEYYDWNDGSTWYSPYSLDTPQTTPGYVTVSGTFCKRLEVNIHIEAVNKIDPIEGILEGQADWYYYACLHDTDYLWTGRYNTGGGDYALVDQDHVFTPNILSVNPIIMLCEDDLASNDDYADISSDSYGGVDNVGNPITPPATYYYGSYFGDYDLRTNSLTGNAWIWDSGFRLTSGDFDGSTAVDENDAEVWFDIWDNYELPVANAGSNQNINTSVTSNLVSCQPCNVVKYIKDVHHTLPWWIEYEKIYSDTYQR